VIAIILALAAAAFTGYHFGERRGKEKYQLRSDNATTERIKKMEIAFEKEREALSKDFNDRLKAKSKELADRNAEIAELKGGAGKPGKADETGGAPLAGMPGPGDSPAADKSKKAQERIRKKLAELLELVELDPTNRESAGLFARWLWGCGNEALLDEISKQIKDIFDTALENDPDNTDLLYNRGVTMAAQMKAIEFKMKQNPMLYGPMMGEVALKAINSFSRVIEADPNDNNALFARGIWLYHFPGRLDDAEKDFGTLMGRARDGDISEDVGVPAIILLSATFKKKGDKESTRKTIEDGLLIYPGNDSLRKQLENLDKE
jgi:tetratricopeptide (TPR) repeat protein